jgi:hypothetical protein
MTGQREAYELLLIEEADAWFEYLEATRGQSAIRYREVEPWAWARLSQRLRAIRTRRRQAEAGGRSGLSCLALAALSARADVNREKDPDRDQIRDHRRSSDADEREGIPVIRDPHRHAEVDEDLEQQREHEPARDDRRERVARDRDDSQASPDHEQIEHEQDRRAEEATLLGERGEDEVRVMLGQEVERGLRRVVDARPRSSPAPIAFFDCVML